MNSHIKKIVFIPGFYQFYLYASGSAFCAMQELLMPIGKLVSSRMAEMELLQEIQLRQVL